MSEYFILEGKEIVSATVQEWSTMFSNRNGRTVAKTQIDGFMVSTVFLGLDHAFDEGPPMLFETMVFSNRGGDYQERCSTYEQAEEMHERICDEVRAGLAINYLNEAAKDI